MDIAGVSMALAQVKASSQASVSVTKKAMDTAEVQMQALLQMMQGASPSFGHQLDIRV